MSNKLNQEVSAAELIIALLSQYQLDCVIVRVEYYTPGRVCFN